MGLLVRQSENNASPSMFSFIIDLHIKDCRLVLGPLHSQVKYRMSLTRPGLGRLEDFQARYELPPNQ